jgi:hypothetical protein
MKILIIGVGRSGTTSLLNGIAKQGYTKIHEPYNKKNHNKKFTLSNDNIVLKTIFGQLPKNYKKEWKELIKELIPKFDKIIWLDRKNMNKHCESFINLHYRSSLQPPTSVFKKWKMEEIPKSFNTDTYNKTIYNALEKEKQSFKELVDELNCKITWYEDLYGKDRIRSLETINKWNLELNPFDLNEYLNPSKKYRQYIKSSLL